MGNFRYKLDFYIEFIIEYYSYNFMLLHLTIVFQLDNVVDVVDLFSRGWASLGHLLYFYCIYLSIFSYRRFE